MPFNVPSWLRWYRKPSYRDFKTFTQTINADIEQGVTSRAPSIISQSDDTIPASLTLDRVLANKTCKPLLYPDSQNVNFAITQLTNLLCHNLGSPLSLYDFYMYLKHIELSPENLESLLTSGSRTMKSDIAMMQSRVSRTRQCKIPQRYCPKIRGLP